MHPGLRLLDEAAEKQGRRDGPGHAVGVTLFRSRSWTQACRRRATTAAAARADPTPRRTPRDLGGQRLVVGIEGRQVGSERHARRARQRREIDQKVGLLLVGKRERIARISRPSASVLPISTESPLRLTRHRRGGSRSGNGILDDGEQDTQPDRQSSSDEHRGEAQGVGRSAHVLLHEKHAGCRLDVQPARVEADTLSDDGDEWRLATSPADVDKARLLGGSPSHGMDHREVALQEIVAAGHSDLRLVNLGETAGGCLERFRPQVVRRAC